MASVLVIEDNAELRQMLQQALTSAGYEVRSASDGTQAASLCQVQVPDLVVTDIYMPNKDGLEVIMDLRNSFPRTKVIAISGQLAQKNMLTVASALGARRILIKPFAPGELLDAAREVLDER